MVPKVAGKGRNFVGAGLYYLHDKKASTRDRVAFTHTENLPTRDPDKAIKCMAYTAMRQQELKSRAGGSAKGRKLEQPVYCYSLSWAPGEDPSQEDMIEAAMDTLKDLGLTEHETLLVGHNDEPHPHIHVIVNRVHPETGVAAKLSKDHLKLSVWAEEFERRQGEIRCEQRVENNALRRQGEFVKDRDSQNSGEFHRWRQERVARQHDKRAMEGAGLDARHERERDQLRIARDRLVGEQRKRVRDATRADWRDLFVIQRQQRTRLSHAQRNAWTRVRFFIRTHGEEYLKAGKAGRVQMAKDSFAALIGSKSQREKLESKQKDERIYFGRKLKDRADRLTLKIRKDHEEKLVQLRERQNVERQDMQSRHSGQSQEEAREIREDRDKEVYRKEKREERRRELLETKRDIEERRESQHKTRGTPLRDRFNASRGKTQGDERKAGEKRPQSQEKEPPRAGSGPASKHKEFREQAKDTTERTQKTQGRVSLAEKFRKAREQNPVEERQEQKKTKFRENAKDAGRDVGRSRTIKPPGGPKRN
ncbi:MAG: relaxase/mobilization nuclease domain-containing protein [Methylocella sp.]